MDPVKLAAYQLTPSDVQAALQKENVDLPSGRIEGQNTEVTLRTEGRLVTEEDFNNMILRQQDGAIVRFKDVGTAIMSSQNERTAMIVSEGNTARYGVGTGAAPGAIIRWPSWMNLRNYLPIFRKQQQRTISFLLEKILRFL
jgi:multidrug efflux pump